MNDQQMIETYEAVAELSRQMLLATQQREWERFGEHETRQATLIDLLKAEDTTPSNDPDTMARKKALIEEILACNAKVQDLVVPWRATIASLLDSVGAARRIAQTYGDSR